MPWHSGSDQFMLTFLLGLIIEECARPESLPSTTYIFAVFEFVSACFTIFTFFVSASSRVPLTTIRDSKRAERESVFESVRAAARAACSAFRSSSRRSTSAVFFSQIFCTPDMLGTVVVERAQDNNFKSNC